MGKLNRFLMYCTSLFMVATLVFANDNSSGHLRKTISTTFVSMDAGGSGSVIKSWKEDGKYYAYVLTADHVIQSTKLLPVKSQFMRSSNGGAYSAVGEVVEHDVIKDFAIVKYQLDYKPNYVVCDVGEYNLLDKVYSVGMPNSMFWVSSGNVSSVIPNKFGSIVHSAPGFYGNSGGPLFNYKGRQIGVNLAIASATERHEPVLATPNINYAISIKEIQKTLGVEKSKIYFGG